MTLGGSIPWEILISSARRLGLRRGPLYQVEFGMGMSHYPFGPEILCETCLSIESRNFIKSMDGRPCDMMSYDRSLVHTKVEKYLYAKQYHYIIHGQCPRCSTIYWGVPGLPVAGEWAE